MDRVFRRIAALFVCVVTLGACQLDVTVDVVVDPDGTGLISVLVTADADVAAAVPTLVDDLVLDDVIAAGWSIDGPNATEEGGLTLQMSHPFRSQGEATALLNSLGPPFTQMELGRGQNGDVTTNQLSGTIVLSDGFGAFADEDLRTAVGGQPFARQIEASGVTPADSFNVTLRALLPGEVNSDATNADADALGVFTWTLPTDGSRQVVQAETTQEPGEGQVWARPLSIVALVALIAWIAFMGAFVLYVTIARFRRARAYKHRNLHPS